MLLKLFFFFSILYKGNREKDKFYGYIPSLFVTKVFHRGEIL